MEAIFTDKEVRDLLNFWKYRSHERDHGDETTVYMIAKIIRNAVEDKLRERSLERLLEEVVSWQKQVFTQATSQSRAEHLYREAKELRDDPSDAQEMADVLFLLAGLADGEGVDLAAAVRTKLAINKAREWGKPDAQGVVEHVRSDVLRSVHALALSADGEVVGSHTPYKILHKREES